MTLLRLATRAVPIAVLLMSLLSGCATSLPAPLLLTLPAAAPNGARVEPLAVASATATAPAPDASQRQPPPQPQPQLAVRRVTLPEYLVSRRVRYRADAATLAEWPNTYWAERIEIGVAREFAAALRRQLPGWGVCDGSCGEPAALLSLDVDMLAMDYLRGSQTLRAQARITVRATEPGDLRGVGLLNGNGNGHANTNGAAPAPLRMPTDDLTFDLPVRTDTAQAHAEAIAALLQQVARAAALRVQAVPR